MADQHFSFTSDEAARSLSDALARTGPRAQQSLLIEAHAARAGNLSPAEVYRQYTTNSFTQLSELDQRAVLEFESMAARVIPADTRMLELSPVTAFASNSSLAGISQKTALTTIRNTEVVADAVIVLALQAAREKREYGSDWSGTSLATFHRELRTQVHEKSGDTPHFRALSLVDAERTGDSLTFKSAMFRKHVSVYLDILASAASIGYETARVTVAMSSMRVIELLIGNRALDRSLIRRHTQTPGFSVFERFGIPLPRMVSEEGLLELVDTLPNEFAYLRRPLGYMRTVFAETCRAIGERSGTTPVDVVFDLDRHAGVGYYEDACVKISATNSLGDKYSLVDIGTNKWLTRVTNDRDDRLITGGMGTEVFIKKFGTIA